MPGMFGEWQGRRECVVRAQDGQGWHEASAECRRCRALCVTVRSVASALCHMKPPGGSQQGSARVTLAVVLGLDHRGEGRSRETS